MTTPNDNDATNVRADDARPVICYVCGKPIESKPGGIDYAKIASILGSKVAHLGCKPREAAMLKQGFRRTK